MRRDHRARLALDALQLLGHVVHEAAIDERADSESLATVWAIFAPLVQPNGDARKATNLAAVRTHVWLLDALKANEATHEVLQHGRRARTRLSVVVVVVVAGHGYRR